MKRTPNFSAWIGYWVSMKEKCITEERFWVLQVASKTILGFCLGGQGSRAHAHIHITDEVAQRKSQAF